MSIIQTVIGSAVGEVFIPPAFPQPGSNYPAGEVTVSQVGSLSIAGYYNSIETPSVGLWRKAYFGEALNGTDYNINFWTNPTVAQTTSDTDVGFGTADDGATNYSMQWLGYFKPEVSGNFVFASSVDDYMFMWMGQHAVENNPNIATAILKDSNTTPIMALTAGKYYPVRIRYTEVGGGNQMALVTGLNNTLLRNNANTGSTGKFYYDGGNSQDSFPGSGLIV